MKVWSRLAEHDDIDELLPLYAANAVEQAELRYLWPYADGLAEPAAESFRQIIDEEDSVVALGLIDDVPVGFVWARIEELLPQAGERRVGVVRIIFTDQGARGVGVGHEMVELAMEWLRERDVHVFDARVSPGHRNAKNFFEAHGFAARLIIMHHSELPEATI